VCVCGGGGYLGCGKLHNVSITQVEGRPNVTCSHSTIIVMTAIWDSQTWSSVGGLPLSWQCTVQHVNTAKPAVLAEHVLDSVFPQDSAALDGQKAAFGLSNSLGEAVDTLQQ